jgi:hypothetical protein
MTQLDYIWRDITTLLNDILGFGLVIGGFYILWVLFSIVIKWGES